MEATAAMIYGILLKAVHKVRAHVRDHRYVQTYTRHSRAGKLFERHYKQIEEWAWRSVSHQIGLGKHFSSPDDAWLAGVERALFALKNYKPSLGDVGSFLRGQIKYAILKHLAWERSHGLVGIRTLYNKIHSAKGEGKETAALELPPVEAIKDDEAAPSIEEILEGSRALFKRDEALDMIEKRYNISLKKVKARLREKEKQKRTWKNTDLVKRKLRVFELRSIQGKDFREIAERLHVDVRDVHKDFKEVSALIKEEFQMKKALDREERLKARLSINIERLRKARAEKFPPAYVAAVKEVLEGILLDLGVGEEG